MAAVPVTRRCNEMKPEMTILMTTTTLSALYCFFHTLNLKKKNGIESFNLFRRCSEVIEKQLPIGVLHQVCMIQCSFLFSELKSFELLPVCTARYTGGY